MIDLIKNNPYRLLGVYSTSPQREIVSNQGKMKAFLKVGKSVSFPLDLPELLPEISRTEQSVVDANAKLTLPNEQLRYAQFWFAKQTPIDDIACGKLTVGDFDAAIDIWNKKTTVSSLQNLIVCSLIKEQLDNAIHYAQILYTNYGKDFVKMILGESALATEENLAKVFLDALSSEYNPIQFLNYITNPEWIEYVGSTCIKPIIENISNSIEVAKSSKGKGSNVRLQAGKKLKNDTKADFSQLKQFLSPDDIQYQMIADKLGLTILQCGIDYYNDSEEPDAANKAMVLQKYAFSIVVGKMAKDRCRENVEILKKIIQELPPLEIFNEDKAIKEELRKFRNLPDKICHSVTLLNNTKPFLQTIKKQLGGSNDYYLKISTLIVGNALHNLIAEVNFVQKAAVSFLDENSSKLSPDACSAAIKYLMEDTVSAAWKATLIMDTFDMEHDFRMNRYNVQRSSLKNLCESIGVISNPTLGISSSRLSNTSSSYQRSSTTSNSSRSSDNDTNWGCIIYLIIGIIALIIGLCS